jgi:hypothetical protein
MTEQTENVVSEYSEEGVDVPYEQILTSKPIAKALLDARKQGVKIEAVIDKSNATARYSAATFLVMGPGMTPNGTAALRAADGNINRASQNLLANQQV